MIARGILNIEVVTAASIDTDIEFQVSCEIIDNGSPADIPLTSQYHNIDAGTIMEAIAMPVIKVSAGHFQPPRFRLVGVRAVPGPTLW
jgi:hypothetical protein|tara:strand:- start:17 stop:280 length:264 start_codon:yes stop_codon:yes gene_type:complete